MLLKSMDKQKKIKEEQIKKSSNEIRENDNLVQMIIVS